MHDGIAGPKLPTIDLPPSYGAAPDVGEQAVEDVLPLALQEAMIVDKPLDMADIVEHAFADGPPADT